MAETRFHTVVNHRTHMVVDRETGRCLGAVGYNFQRPWVFPLYTPAGYTVLQEYPFEHPWHNGCFVGQDPVIVGERQANFWAVPPQRQHNDPLFNQPGSGLGRMDIRKAPTVRPHRQGIEFRFDCVWVDANEQPLIDEVRTVNLYAGDDATICDIKSEKIATYGAVEYPPSKHGGFGIRVEQRLIPLYGGIIMADSDRRGSADVVHEQDADFVAYESDVPGGGRFGVLMAALDGAAHAPWFVRDYGLAGYNPTWKQAHFTPAGEVWTISLRVVAYDGQLAEARARRWL